MRITFGGRDVLSGHIREVPRAQSHAQLHQDHGADQQGQRNIFGHLGLETGKVHIKHHDHKEEQHRDRTDIDDDQQHGDEFGAQQHK